MASWRTFVALHRPYNNDLGIREVEPMNTHKSVTLHDRSRRRQVALHAPPRCVDQLSLHENCFNATGPNLPFCPARISFTSHDIFKFVVQGRHAMSVLVPSGGGPIRDSDSNSNPLCEGIQNWRKLTLIIPICQNSIPAPLPHCNSRLGMIEKPSKCLSNTMRVPRFTC
jgi:hypothetical protein